MKAAWKEVMKGSLRAEKTAVMTELTMASGMVENLVGNLALMTVERKVAWTVENLAVMKVE